MVNENYLYKSPTHVANLNEMRLRGKLCDVTVKVEHKELRAHKVILAANLNYFESMFLNSFHESKRDVVLMQDVDGSDLEAFISYAYTGEMLLTKSNALGLLQVADYLNEDAIKKACIDFLEIYLDASDAIRAYRFANAIECLSLKNAAMLRIQSNFEVCSQTTEYLDLDFESLKDIMNDMQFDNVELQELLFEGIMRWIMHDPKNRRIHINDMSCFIDITKLADSYMMNYLGNMADRSADDFGIVKCLMSYHHRCSKIEKAKIPVKNVPQVLMLLDDFNDKRFFHIYDFTERKWSSLQEIPNDQGKPYCMSTILHDRIYYVGRNNPTTSYQLEIFNPTTRRTTVLHFSDMLGGLTMCACNKFVFLCGGCTGLWDSSDKILRYDPRTDHMKTLAPMGNKRYGAAAIFYEGHLFVLGGHDGNSCVDLVEKYDFSTDKWTAFPSMIVPRMCHAAAVLDGKLYACGGGGSFGISSVEIYDPAQNSWRQVANMNQRRRQFLVVAREGKLWAIAGDEEKTVEVYDPSRNQWQMDHEISSGLQMQHPSGGLISASRITHAK